MGSSFQDYHTQHLTKLEWGHATPDPKLTLPGSDGKHYHYILPAVYKLIQHLRDQKRDFNLVIRTYGLDCENVLKSLNHCIEGKQHPSFPDLPDMSLRLHSGHIVRQDGDKIKLQVNTFGYRHIWIKLIPSCNLGNSQGDQVETNLSVWSKAINALWEGCLTPSVKPRT